MFHVKHSSTNRCRCAVVLTGLIVRRIATGWLHQHIDTNCEGHTQRHHQYQQGTNEAALAMDDLFRLANFKAAALDDRVFFTVGEQQRRIGFDWMFCHICQAFLTEYPTGRNTGTTFHAFHMDHL